MDPTEFRSTSDALRTSPSYAAHPVTAALCFLSTGLAIGIVADRCFAAPVLQFVAVALVPLVCGLARWRLSPRFVLPVVCSAVGIAVGAVRHHQTWQTAPGTDIRYCIDEQRPRLLRLNGIVISREDRLPRSEQGRPTTRLIVRTQAVQGDGPYRKCSGDVLAEAITESLVGVETGRSVTVSGWIEAVPEALNPGEWSPRRYWRSRGIAAFADLRTRGSIRSAPEGHTVWWRAYREQARQAACSAIRDAVGADRAGLVEALVLGMREGVAPSALDAFRDSGTIHLLAISGMHLQVVSLFVMILARRAGLGLTWVAAAVIVVSGGYAFLVTGGASVLRSTVMAVTLATSLLMRRPGAFAHRMAMAALVVLWLSPSDLFDAGAQLSFLGTLALVGAASSWSRLTASSDASDKAHPLERFWTSDPRSARFAFHLASVSGLNRTLIRLVLHTTFFAWDLIRLMLGGLFVSVVVWGVTSVLVGYHFDALNPVAILANLPLTPLTSLALILGLAGLSLCMAGMAWFGTPFLNASAWAMSICVDGLAFALEHWSKPWPIFAVTTFVVVGFYLLAALCWAPTPSFAEGLRSRRMAWGIPPAFLCVSMIGADHLRRMPPEHLEAEVLAVDHGLAVLLRWPDGANWLYDCGRMGRPDVGRNLIAPALRQRGVDRLDALIVSHADADHYNGIESLIESGIGVDAFLSTDRFFASAKPEVQRFVERLRGLGVSGRSVAAGDRLRDDRHGTARVLAPDPGAANPLDSDNSGSLVLELSALGSNLILTGDLEGDGLSRFAAEFADARPTGDCDVLLAPHHGGIASNPPWLYETIQPRLVVSSQGRNRFGMVTGLSERIAAYSPETRLLTTAAAGAVRLRWSPEGIAYRSFLENGPESRLPLRNPRSEPGLAGAAHVVLNP
jgi:competence protein ComEC